MIITIQKPFQKILESLQNHKDIFVVGCAACASKCQTGGEQEVKKMTDDLKIAGKNIIGYAVLDTPCDIRIAKRDLKKYSSDNQNQAFLILACGAGVQSIEKVVKNTIFPALDPVFTGTTERIGVYHEYCMLCGECILDKTGGICPIARCAKRLINGPCGGVVNGKCEIDKDRDCAWVLIFEKIKNKDKIKEYTAPRSFFKPKKINKI